VDDLRDFYRLAQRQDQGQADGWAPKTREYLRDLPALVTADDASPDTRQAVSVTPPDSASPGVAQPNARPHHRTPSTLIDPDKVTFASNAAKAEAPQVSAPQSLGWKLMRGSQLWEKNPYRFANYRRAQARSVLFPGCNFMAMYPRTLRHLEQLLDAHGVGVLYECCYQPVASLGLADDAQSNHTALRRRLDELGVRELISVCPTCHYFLSSRIGIPVVTVYEKLRQLGEGTALNLPELPLFIPCPDRRKRQIIESMVPFLPSSAYEAFGDVPCCGLGGFMAWRRPMQAERMLQALRDRVAEAGRGCPGVESAGGGAGGCAEGCGVGVGGGGRAEDADSRGASGDKGDWRFYTYCASCVSQFRRLGIGQAEHLLPLILGVDETPQRGAMALANRALGKLR
jgi:Fe-S oxidoreductase